MAKVARETRTPRAGGFALGIFALLVVAAPLVFGAVDRVFQIGLVALLALGVAIRPPAVGRPGRLMNGLILAGLGLLLVREFAPAAWFGTTLWRKTLLESYGVVFPWTHNPEPSRALDALLAGALGVVWFLWVRTLAMERANRPVLAWSLFASAAIVATVSFATRGIDPAAIYGLRFTPGWTGFGPFPNRNHTGCFLAMGLVLGAGCIAAAGGRKRYGLVLGGVAMLGLIFAALLTTQSRGGLLVAVLGLGIFLGLVLLKFRSRRALGMALGVALVLGAAGLAFGTQVLARFTSKEGGDVSTQTRVAVWKDTVEMWKDAPVFGHGLASFTQVFPMYQVIETGGRPVLHPESSWLQWLVELGALAVALGIVALLVLIAPRLRDMFSTQRSFFLRAAGFAAAAVLLIHALIDVPAHRWGTAGFALAALALACTPGEGVRLLRPTRKASLVPLGVAAFWVMPFAWGVPEWSPLSLARLLARDRTTLSMPASELDRATAFFPLSAALHHAIGMRQLAAPRDYPAREWARHFSIALRLQPGSWWAAVDQARACTRVAPGFALHYWQKAVERAGDRADEALRLGLAETARLPGAAAAWNQYAESHPDLLLTYADMVPETVARTAFERWWEDRGSRAGALPDAEIETFYRLAPRFGTRAQLDLWMKAHADRLSRDARTWAVLLHGWKADADAWRTLAAAIPEPPFSATTPRDARDLLEGTWQLDPENVVNARDLAQVLATAGDAEGSRGIIVAVARRADAPRWFVEKAAHLLAASGLFAEAVELLITPRIQP